MNPKLLQALTVGVLGLSAVFVSTEPTRADVIDPTVFSPTALDFGPVALNQSVTLPLNVSVNLNSFEPGLIVNDLVASITGANFTFIADPSNVQPCFNLDGGCIYHITFTQRGTNMQGLFGIDYSFLDPSSLDPSTVLVTDGVNLTASLASGTSATPLPAALPLFATGLGALGLLSWRRKKKAQAVA
jgi:hypothetical protein